MTKTITLVVADKVILFLSDGRPTDNGAEILNTISTENAKLGNQVVIQTFGIGQYASEYTQILQSRGHLLVVSSSQR